MFEAIERGPVEAAKFYNKWVEHVKRTVPSDRLLVFEAKQGWKPLCDFLNLPIPDEPFPHVNDTAAMKSRHTKITIMAYTTIYGIPILIAIFVAMFMFS